MSISEERYRMALDREEKHETKVRAAKVMRNNGYSNADIAESLQVSEETVRSLLEEDI